MALTIAVVLVCFGLGSPAGPTTTVSGLRTSINQRPAYTVEGKSIRKAGVPFTPNGITTFGLSRPNWEANVSSDLARIAAIASFWHGNVVRIQIAPPIFLANPPGYVATMKREVRTALRLRLNVILSAQYQSVGYIPGPNASTVSFWRAIARTYRNTQQVWFDLFNEPDQPSWKIWKHGGSGFVGMQTLVDTIRAIAPHNLVIAEGLRQAETLSGVESELLKGSGVVYSVHPYLLPGLQTPQSWDTNWGDLSSRIPILVGEWGEYNERKPQCALDAPQLVPDFLDYLHRHHIGLIAWALVPGVLVRGSSLTEPTQFDPGVPWTCTGGLDPGSGAQGPGGDILRFFEGST